MSWIGALLSLFVLASSPAIAVLAQAAATSTSTSTTTPSQSPRTGSSAQDKTNSPSFGAALGIGLGVGAGISALTALSNFSFSSPFLKSFGGRILTVTPCISPLGPSLHITIAPAGVFQPSYIWTPATITYLAGPPRNPGQQVLGLADVPYGCYIPIPVPPYTIPLAGQRIFEIGTSPLI